MWVSLYNQLQTFILVINMSEKRTRLSNGDKIAILEAIRIPGYKKEIMKQCNIGKTAFYCIIQQERPQEKEKIAIKHFDRSHITHVVTS